MGLRSGIRMTLDPISRAPNLSSIPEDSAQAGSASRSGQTLRAQKGAASEGSMMTAKGLHKLAKRADDAAMRAYMRDIGDVSGFWMSQDAESMRTIADDIKAKRASNPFFRGLRETVVVRLKSWMNMEDSGRKLHSAGPAGRDKAAATFASLPENLKQTGSKKITHEDFGSAEAAELLSIKKWSGPFAHRMQSGESATSFRKNMRTVLATAFLHGGFKAAAALREKLAETYKQAPSFQTFAAGVAKLAEAASAGELTGRPMGQTEITSSYMEPCRAEMDRRTMKGVEANMTGLARSGLV